MTDEQLLVMYKKYKKKRIILFILLITIILISISIYLCVSNTPRKDKVETNKSTNNEVIEDQTAPEIKLNIDNIEIMRGGDIDYLKYIESVIDDIDGDLMSKLTYVEIDTSLVGEQKIIYNVSDSSGNTSQAIIKVNILEKEIPIDNSSQQLSSSNPEPPTQDEITPSSNSGSVNSTKPSDETKIPSHNQTQTNSSQETIVKYFLFSDGYTMLDVSDICATELKKTNRTGMCSPIQDENGIYLGMKLVVE